MAAGQDSEAIIATLEEAKVKLGEAQRHTFAGLTRLGKIRSAIEFTLGRLGRGNPAITLLRDAEKSIKDRAVEINGLSARVDKAIAEIRNAAGGGSSGASSDPASKQGPFSGAPFGKRAAGDADFHGSGYSLDEMVEFVHGHTGGGNPAMGRPNQSQIEDALRNAGPVRLEGQNAAKFEHGGVRVIVNYDLPWRSTAYFPGR